MIKFVDVKILAVIFMLGITPALAENTMLIAKNRSSVVSGIVTEVKSESIMLANDQNPIRVELGKLDIDQSLDKLIQPGMQVTVQGRFKELGSTPVFEADSILRSGDSSITGAEALLLNRGFSRR